MSTSALGIVAAGFSLLPFVSNMIETVEGDIQSGATKKKVVMDASLAALTDVGALAGVDTSTVAPAIGDLIDTVVSLKNALGWKTKPIAVGPEPVIPPVTPAPTLPVVPPASVIVPSAPGTGGQPLQSAAPAATANPQGASPAAAPASASAGPSSAVSSSNPGVV